LTRRLFPLALLVTAFIAALVLLFMPVQYRQRQVGGNEFFVSAIFILPFVLLPLIARPLQRVTRVAWILAVVMAFDVVFWAVAVFAPTGGHPSFEGMATLLLGMAKPILVPVAAVLLSIGFLRGERFVIVAIGFVCLLAEGLYGFYPIDWLFMSS
jgi:peptidoglycan/LPS O-acetylase OafA/YrhL